MKLSGDKGMGIEAIKEVRSQDVECSISEYVCSNSDNGRELDGEDACT